MSANVGLPTPRGSGTSGYVQSNRAFIRPQQPQNTRQQATTESEARRQTTRDPEIEKHERLRKIELRVTEYRDELEDQNEQDEANGRRGKTDEQLDEMCNAYRADLLGEYEQQEKKLTRVSREGTDRRLPGPGGWERPRPDGWDRRGHGFGHGRYGYRDWDRSE